ncbi:hypothetical protein NQ318_005627 [Aromia moschata]|uniref:Tyr recombinase domain-containing protein n=1 Tax=Aromia moschata TaxID=1265417 RepID=A0AAV8X387_9CUCU|nr:hypothetical protein NQ318_005627 [Aromia moschata]
MAQSDFRKLNKMSVAKLQPFSNEKNWSSYISRLNQYFKAMSIGEELKTLISIIAVRENFEELATPELPAAANAPANANHYMYYRIALYVAMILGIMWACRRHELHHLRFDHVRYLEGILILNIVETKTKIRRTFTITGKYYDICKKDINLLQKYAPFHLFFVNYYNVTEIPYKNIEICPPGTVQNVEMNKFENLGKQIAKYLNLSDANLYTGHCFRRTSTTVLVDAGGDITALKRHGGWKSMTVAEGYIENSIKNKINVSNIILNSIENQSNEININISSSSTVNTRAPPQINFTNCTIANLHINKK